MSDFFAEALPNWIAAVSTAGALVAASIAGRYAAKAAHWTGEQAKATADQAEMQAEALALAKVEAEEARGATERERAERAHSERNIEERRLDALAPDIFAAASPGIHYQNGGFGVEVSNGNGESSLLDAPGPFGLGDSSVSFRQCVVVRFENVSAVPARLDVVELHGGAFQYAFDKRLEAGAPIWVLPGEVEQLAWWRTVSLRDLVDGEGVIDPRGYVFGVEFWARDVGMNVRTLYKFNGTVMHVHVDGSSVFVGPVPPSGWTDRVAVPVGRTYERLAAADLAAEGLTGLS